MRSMAIVEASARVQYATLRAGSGRISAWSVREDGPPEPPKPRLLERVRQALQARHMSRRYILFHGKRHPASTQNQALSALLFLLYGAGLRVLECCRLRVQDIDFAANQLVVRGGKGDKDRVTMLPAVVKADLGPHLEVVRAQHQDDLAAGAGWVALPTALLRKYPNAGREWVWQWVFPATRVHRDQAPTPCATRSRRTCLRTATTMIYTHVLNRGPAAVRRSPADRMVTP